MGKIICHPECKLCGTTLNDSEYCPSCGYTKEEVQQLIEE